MRAFYVLASATLLSVLMFAAPVQAQSDLSNRVGKLEQDVQRLQKQGGKGGGAAVDTSVVETSSEMTQRVLALEHLVEQLTGELQETRYNAGRTAKELQVLQDDVGLRLARIEQALGMAGAPPPDQQGQAAPPPSGAEAAPEASPPQSARAGLSAPVATASGPPEGINSNGGFVIRTDAAGRPLPPDPNAPQALVPAPAAPPQQAVPKAAPGPGPVTSGQIASAPAAPVTLPEGTPKQQYEFAFDFLKKQDYPHAESALRDFLKLHPKDPLAGNAQYWLGETYYVRGDFQQAAVEFMAGYQKYPKTNKGPDNLLKLGMSMAKLNQSQGACTALGRINKDYPDAPDAILKQAKSEYSKLKCK